MTGRWPLLAVASAALLATGGAALAQSNSVQAQNSTAPAQNGVVDDPRLQNFTLNGTVTRRPDPAPAAQQPRQQSPRPQAQAPPTAPPQARAPAADTAPPPAAPARPAEGASTTFALPPATGLPVGSDSSSDFADLAPPVTAPAAEPVPEPEGQGASVVGELPFLPWLIAALALAGAAAWFLFSRNRRRESYAGAGDARAFEAPAAAPAPAPRAARPEPAPAPQPEAPAVPAGIISTRLRPSLDMAISPQRLVLDAEKASLELEVALNNNGNTAAGDISFDAILLNVGPTQDEQIRRFFAERRETAGAIRQLVPPGQTLGFKLTVPLPLKELPAISLEGRLLLVPLLALNIRYRWGSGEAQSAGSYVVGRRTEGEKLAPFRIDLGPRVFRNLDAREHDLRVRT